MANGITHYIRDRLVMLLCNASLQAPARVRKKPRHVRRKTVRQQNKESAYESIRGLLASRAPKF